ncbi:hypothetical protein AB0N79_36720 [Streptomyces microflavus]|uniref:hypothetical protein n=1 Tax=Streptomyces microflavus TaxID=1919 RepID=UPI0022500C2B|nr:hypothetical protein [Streptomyces microflavus]MCX4657304.1 hypothetical protein [Streptomyces microflavus]
MWDYAKLSTDAAKHGGPAGLRAALTMAGLQQGFKMGQVVALKKGVKIGVKAGVKAGRGQGGLVGIGMGAGGVMLYNWLRTPGVDSTDAEPVRENVAEAPAAPQESRPSQVDASTPRPALDRHEEEDTSASGPVPAEK